MRRCTAGHLVEVYRTRRGTVGFRCPAKPVAAYVQKGGQRPDTEGSICLYNGLLATAGYPQRDKLGTEAPVITLGDDVSFIQAMMRDPNGSYSADDAMRYLLSRRAPD